MCTRAALPPLAHTTYKRARATRSEEREGVRGPSYAPPTYISIRPAKISCLAISFSATTATLIPAKSIVQSSPENNVNRLSWALARGVRRGRKIFFSPNQFFQKTQPFFFNPKNFVAFSPAIFFALLWKPIARDYDGHEECAREIFVFLVAANIPSQK